MPERWGPEAANAPIVALFGRMDVPDPAGLTGRLRSASELVGVPLQAVRSDRVVSFVQLVVAAEHARRAVEDGRARTRNIALEFLLYMGADRQIHRALDEVGVPIGQRVPVCLVALAPVEEEGLAQAARALDIQVERTWTGTSHAPHAHVDGARRYWAERLRLPGGASEDDVEVGVYEAMALLAVAKA